MFKVTMKNKCLNILQTSLKKGRRTIRKDRQPEGTENVHGKYKFTI